MNVTHEDCTPFREALSLMGDKWSVLLVYSLHQGPKRFTELKHLAEGISQRMLTLTLRKLERDGLVTRTVYPTIPPRVDYELTEIGQSLLKPVGALFDWAARNSGAIAASRRNYDSRS